MILSCNAAEMTTLTHIIVSHVPPTRVYLSLMVGQSIIHTVTSAPVNTMAVPSLDVISGSGSSPVLSRRISWLFLYPMSSGSPGFETAVVMSRPSYGITFSGHRRYVTYV